MTLDSGDAYYNGGKGWSPLPFTPNYGWGSGPAAILDGNGHVIVNLAIDRSDDAAGKYAHSRNYGLFGLIGHNRVVQNLGVVHAYVRGPGNPDKVFIGEHSGGVGILAGAMNGSARVEAVWIQGEVQGNSWTGGMIGRNDGRIFASSVQAQVKAVGTPAENAYAGGLVGLQNDHGYIHSSFALGGSVKSTGGAGGLVGKTRKGSRIENSYAAVPLDGYEVGGLVAADEGGGIDGVKNSYWDAWLVPFGTKSDGGIESNTYELTHTGIGVVDGIYEHWDELPPTVAPGTTLWDANYYPVIVYKGIHNKWGGVAEARMLRNVKTWAPAAWDQLGVWTDWSARRRASSSDPDVLSGAWQWQESDNGVDGWTDLRLQRIAGTFHYHVGADRYGKFLRARVLKRPNDYPETYPEVQWFTRTIRIMAVDSNHNWVTNINPAPQVGVASTFGTTGRRDILGLTGAGERVERWVQKICDDTILRSNCDIDIDAPRQWTPDADDANRYVGVTAFWSDPRPDYKGLFQAQEYGAGSPILPAAPANPPAGARK